METDAGVFYKIKEVMDRYNIPSWIWQPIAELESGFNPLATNITDREYSLGIFQINVAAHPEFASYNLYDPAENAEAIAKLWSSRGVIEQAKALPTDQQAAYVWRYGSRPAWTPDLETKITGLSREVLADEMPSDSGYYDQTDYSKYLFLIKDDLEKLGLAEIAGLEQPEAGAGEEISLDWKTIVIRGLAYGLIFIFIFIALINMVKPEILPEDVQKVVKTFVK